MSSQSHGNSGTIDVLRKVLLVAFLVAGMLFLHRFAVPGEHFDPRGMLALGFVVLAAFTIGELVEVVKLPHITGYLLAGMMLGPEMAKLVPSFAKWLNNTFAAGFPDPLILPAPLHEGVLNGEVQLQLGLIKSLALALIALTAGGELKISELKEGIGQIVGILAGQAVFLGVAIIGGLVLAVQLFPGAIPSLSTLDITSLLALGAVIAAVSFATSPAATIAVINGMGAKGPMTKTVLSAVVFKDVLVVIFFSAATAIATSVMGLSSGGGFLLSLWHIVQSIFLGLFVGFGIHLYLRFIGAEILLFLVGLIFTTTFFATKIHAEPLLVFIVAGMVISNFSDLGEKLVHEVERLSLPVYVVFFTLTGAHLDLRQLWGMLYVIAALVGLRVLSFYVGVKLGAMASSANDNLKQYGWMGFVSQAGLAISLAGEISGTYPNGVGVAISSVIVGGIAINEMLGPVLLQWGIGLAGEGATSEPQDTPVEVEEKTPVLPLDDEDPWGIPQSTGHIATDDLLFDLARDLQSVCVENVRTAARERSRELSGDVRELRRDFLKMHRRISVAVQTADRLTDMPQMLRSEVGSLGLRWRDLVLLMSIKAERDECWNPMELVRAVDNRVLQLPLSANLPWSKHSFDPRPEGLFKRIIRSWQRITIRSDAKRPVPLRNLLRFHLSGHAPLLLEGTASLIVNSELDTGDQISSIFLSISKRYEEVARCIEGRTSTQEIRQALKEVQQEVLSDFNDLHDMLGDLPNLTISRAAAAYGGSLKAAVGDLIDFGTADLPSPYFRRLSNVFSTRNQGLIRLTEGLSAARGRIRSRHQQIALQLELIGLQARMNQVLHVHGEHLARALRGKGAKQLGLVEEAVDLWLEKVIRELDKVNSVEELSLKLRTLSHGLTHRLDEATLQLKELAKAVNDDHWLQPLLSDLAQPIRDLSMSYSIPDRQAPRGEWVLPAPIQSVDIPFQELASAYIDTIVTRDLADLSAVLTQTVSKMDNAVAEISRVLRFNLDLALHELTATEQLDDQKMKLVRQILVDAIKRIQPRMIPPKSEGHTLSDEIEGRITHLVTRDFQRLSEQILDGDTRQLRRTLLTERSRGLLDAASVWQRGFGGLSSRAMEAIRHGLGSERYSAMRSFLGLPSEPSRIDLRSALTAPVISDACPLAYRRLFLDHALEAADLLSSRQDELSMLRSVLSSGSKLSSVAITGLDHRSNLALAQAAARAVGDQCHLWNPKFATVEYLEKQLGTLTASSVVIIEDLGRWFRREPGQTQALTALTHSMLDHSEVRWLLVADPVVWNLASQLASINNAVGQVCEVGPLGRDQLKAALLTRHAMSGFKLRFQAEADVAFQVAHLMNRGEGVGRDEAAWFQTLHDASMGSLHDSLRLWMAAIRGVDADHILLGPVSPPPVSRLHSLDNNTLLMLYTLVQQGWMDASSLASLFRLSPVQARAQLAQLCHLGLISEREPFFVLVPHLRGALQEVFHSRGWV